LRQWWWYHSTWYRLLFVLFAAFPGLHCPVYAFTAVVNNDSTTFLILGGSGRIGTAVATHLLLRRRGANVILVGRDNQRGRIAVEEVKGEYLKRKTIDQGQGADDVSSRVSFQCFDWKDMPSLETAVSECDCLIHTAGPYLNEKPLPLSAAIASPRCKTFVDVSDPLEFLDASISMSETAAKSGTAALLAAGAFPGMSNVLAMEGASKFNTGEGQRCQIQLLHCWSWRIWRHQSVHYKYWIWRADGTERQWTRNTFSRSIWKAAW
jgi:saccharopine dehydrogenase-like NADP-dependent oxidoreductase